jgi:hypothetical protein
MFYKIYKKNQKKFMYNIKLVDNHFSHAEYSTDNQKSKYIIWDRSIINDKDKLVVYTDTLLSCVKSDIKTKIGWMLESPAITENYHNWISKNYKNFDLVLTNNRKHIEINSDIFKFSPTGGCWILPEEQKIYDKKRLVSGIFSDKRYTSGQALRHQIVNLYKNKIDTYGRGYLPIPNKIYGLKDYAFSLVIENTKQDYYFTEKLIDCFMTGTIPIYWGCPSIGDFFDTNGMICFNDIHDMDYILNTLNFDMYITKLDSIKNNFETAKKYLIAEDYMFENYLKNMIVE